MSAVITRTPEQLLESVRDMKADAYRLVQMHGRRNETEAGDGFELTYSFDKNLDLRHIRLEIAPGVSPDSITGIYSYAFLYENEIHDLFGVQFVGMTPDYQGTFYRTATPAPMADKGGSAHGK